MVVNWKLAFLLAIGGALGTLARFGLSQLAMPYSLSLPWGTVAINILGSFIIGAFGTLTLSQGRFPLPEDIRLFVMVGICGGFTTFSSFSLQTFDLMRSGALGRAAVNVLASVILCLAAVAIGHFAAGRINGDARQIAQIDAEEMG
jgi:CrcB protein